MKKLLAILLTFLLLQAAKSQTIQYKDSIVISEIKFSVTHDSTIKVTHDSTAFRTDTFKVEVPVVGRSELRAIYVVLDQEKSDTAALFKYLVKHNCNFVSYYARLYLQTSKDRAFLASLFERGHKYGIGASVDVRETNEIPYWEIFFLTYKNPINRPDAMTTEKEPYITGDYAGYYALLQVCDVFATNNNIKLIVYMGHPTQAAWDSTVKHCDEIWLSNYITMSTYAKTTGLWDYVKGRWGYITNSCNKFGKTNFPVGYITSLEMIKYGAKNDFMGDAYINQMMYGLITTKAKAQYETNASGAVKNATDLIGTIIFYRKFSKQINIIPYR